MLCSHTRGIQKVYQWARERKVYVFPKGSCLCINASASHTDSCICMYGDPKATGLERIRQELYALKDINSKTKVTQELNKEKLKSKHGIVQELRNELDELLQLDKYDEKIARMTAKIYWSEVNIQEQVVQTAEGSVDKAKKKVQVAFEKLKELENSLSSHESIDEMSAEGDKLKDQLAGVSAESVEHQSMLNEAHKEVLTKERELRQINQNKNELRSRIDGCQKQVRYRIRMISRTFSF